MMTAEKPKTTDKKVFDCFLPDFFQGCSDQELIKFRIQEDYLPENTEFRIFISGNYSASIEKLNGIYKVVRPVIKFKGEPGLRITDDLTKVHIRVVVDALNIYFGGKESRKKTLFPPEEDPALTCYSREVDLFRWLYRITDDMRTSTSDSDRTVLSSLANLGLKEQFSDDINNNMLVRSLDSEDLPFHAFVIKFSDIEEALSELDFEYYQHLHIWLFSHRKIKIEEEYRKNYFFWKSCRNKESSKNPRTNGINYERARRLKYNALGMLRLRIIELLKQKNK
jgi:hypothetical protein